VIIIDLTTAQTVIELCYLHEEMFKINQYWSIYEKSNTHGICLLHSSIVRTQL